MRTLLGFTALATMLAAPALAQLTIDTAEKLDCVATLSVQAIVMDRVYPTGSAVADAAKQRFEAGMDRLLPELNATPISGPELEQFDGLVREKLTQIAPALADGPLPRGQQMLRESQVDACFTLLLDSPG